MFKRPVAKIGDFTFAAVLAIASLYPVLWLFSISFQPDTDAYKVPTKWFFKPDFANYQHLLSDPNFVASLINSLQLTVISTLLCVIFGTLSAYALSRFKVRGAMAITRILAFSRLVPSFAIVIPTFFIYRKFNMLDTMPGLILALVAFQVPLSTLIMYRIINAIPRAFDESASLDGAGFFRTLWQVILPIAKPGLVASAVVTFILVWNEFLFVLVLAGNKIVTIPITIATFQSDKQILWGSIAAASVISLLPIMLFFAFAQKYLLSGMGMGALRD